MMSNRRTKGEHLYGGWRPLAGSCSRVVGSWRPTGIVKFLTVVFFFGVITGAVPVFGQQDISLSDFESLVDEYTDITTYRLWASSQLQDLDGVRLGADLFVDSSRLYTIDEAPDSSQRWALMEYGFYLDWPVGGIWSMLADRYFAMHNGLALLGEQRWESDDGAISYSRLLTYRKGFTFTGVTKDLRFLEFTYGLIGGTDLRLQELMSMAINDETGESVARANYSLDYVLLFAPFLYADQLNHFFDVKLSRVELSSLVSSAFGTLNFSRAAVQTTIGNVLTTWIARYERRRDNPFGGGFRIDSFPVTDDITGHARLILGGDLIPDVAAVGGWYQGRYGVMVNYGRLTPGDGPVPGITVHYRPYPDDDSVEFWLAINNPELIQLFPRKNAVLLMARLRGGM